MNDATGSSADVSLPAHAALNALFTGTASGAGAVPAPFLQESFWQTLRQQLPSTLLAGA